MNLSAYDNVEQQFDSGTWVNPNFKRLYSTELPYKPFYTFLKKFDTETNETSYYLALLNNNSLNTSVHRSIYTKHNVLKIDLRPIWNESTLNNLTDKAFISYEKVQEEEDGIIYYLDI